MPSFPPAPPLAEVGPGLHALRLPLPTTARIEYRLVIRQGRRLLATADPANPPDATNPFGTNSVLTGPEYELPWFAASASEGRGSVHEIRVQSKVLLRRRHHHVYLPFGVSRKDVQALLLVHDGGDFLVHGGLGGALDLLVEKEVLPQLAAVLLNPRDRITEYTASVGHSLHVVSEVIPHVARRLRIWASPERTIAMGSSLGAVASVGLLAHHPQHVSAAISLSGSWAHRTDADRQPAVFAPVIEFLDTFDASSLAGRRIYQSVGRYEGLVDFNRRLHPRLQAAGIDVKSVETWTGHDWGAWRDRLEDALSFVLPRSRLQPKN